MKCVARPRATMSTVTWTHELRAPFDMTCQRGIYEFSWNLKVEWLRHLRSEGWCCWPAGHERVQGGCRRALDAGGHHRRRPQPRAPAGRACRRRQRIRPGSCGCCCLLGSFLLLTKEFTPEMCVTWLITAPRWEDGWTCWSTGAFSSCLSSRQVNGNGPPACMHAQECVCQQRIQTWACLGTCRRLGWRQVRPGSRARGRTAAAGMRSQRPSSRHAPPDSVL